MQLCVSELYHCGRSCATLLYAGLSGFWALVLTLRVGLARQREGVLIGYGESEEVLRVVRAHGNNMEYVPLLLLLLALAELSGAPIVLVHAVGVGIVFGRVAHGMGLWRSTGRTLGRLSGALTTLACLITMSGYLLYRYIV